MSAGDFYSNNINNGFQLYGDYPITLTYATTGTVAIDPSFNIALSGSYIPYLPDPNLMEKVVEQNTKKEEPIMVIPEKKKRKFSL